MAADGKQSSIENAVSVIVPTHNYARFLSACLQSILGQTKAPLEIIVVDDASEDNPAEVIASFNDPRIRYLRVDHRCPVRTRKAGLELARGEFVCCVDADDEIDPFYLETGLKRFEEDYRIGFVYSDYEYRGAMKGRSCYAADSDAQDIEYANFIHAGALVRKEVLLLTDVLSQPLDDNILDDWVIWKELLSKGYRAVKQSALYRYRRHAESRTFVNKRLYDYYEAGNLAHAPVSLVLTASNRYRPAQDVLKFLHCQTWPREKCSVVILHDLPNQEEVNELRRELLALEYYSVMLVPIDDISAIQNIREPKEITGLFGTFSRNYGPLLLSVAKRLPDTPAYSLILDDFVEAPADIVSKLLRNFCEQSIAVAAEVRTSKLDRPTALYSGAPLSVEPRVYSVRAAAFSCMMVRTRKLKEIAKQIEIQWARSNSLFSVEEQFFMGAGKQAVTKVVADTGCVLNIQGKKALHRRLQPLFNEISYLKHNPDVREAIGDGHFIDGLDHFIQFGESEGRQSIYFDTTFKEDSYLAANPDVREAILAGKFKDGFEHYVRHGKQEGRKGGYHHL